MKKCLEGFYFILMEYSILKKHVKYIINSPILIWLYKNISAENTGLTETKWF